MSSSNQPGSITLKSSIPMEYSRGVLSNKWHVKREAEPKDNELWSGDKPSLHQSSYKLIGKNIPSDIISSSTESHSKQEEVFRLLKESQGIDPRREMVDMLNKDRLNENIAAYQSNYNSCLPTHKKDHDQHHLETTYGKDYVHPHPELLNVKSEKTKKHEFENSVDNSFRFRKMISQFSDIDAPKREGINTFHVQHGEYPNQKLKHQFMAKNQNKIFDY